MQPKQILLKVNTKEISWESSFVVSEKKFNCCSEIQNWIEIGDGENGAFFIANGNLDNHGVMMIVVYVINIWNSHLVIVESERGEAKFAVIAIKRKSEQRQ